MTIEARLRRAMFWGTGLLVAAAAGAAWIAYNYATDSATLAAWIDAESPRYFPGSRLAIGRVKPRPLLGQVTLEDVELWQDLGGEVEVEAEAEAGAGPSPDHLAARIAWLKVHVDTSALLDGRIEPSEIVVAYPEVRLRRRPDGTWNVQGLLADPWPGPPVVRQPRVRIQNGIVHLIGDDDREETVLREVSAAVEPTPEGLLRFEGTARGGAFDRVRLAGTIDPATGRLSLESGELAQLEVGEALLRQVPVEARPALEAAGLEAGAFDLAVRSLTFDPGATPRLRYDVGVRLRSGLWQGPQLPFPLDDVEADVSVRDGLLTVDRAEGRNGAMRAGVRPGATIDLAGSGDGPFDLTLDVRELELDRRLRAWTPRDLRPLWDEYKPRGMVNLSVRARRDLPGGPVGFGLGVDCQGVGIEYRLFPYPIDGVRGTLTWEGPRLNLVLRATVGGKPAGAVGTIQNPALITGPPPRFGPEPEPEAESEAIAPSPPVPDEVEVRLRFWAEALPIDRPLIDAMPPDVRQVVEQFQPTGTVRGEARLVRTPPESPDDPPEGKVAIDANVDLGERCSVKWVEMPYPIEALSGRLELHPDSWVFHRIRGRNGLAEISGEGAVQAVGPNKFAVDLQMKADRLPFTEELKQALPDWRDPWETLRPSGTCTVEARIRVDPDGREHQHLEIVPGRETRIELRLPSLVDPAATVDMPPMEQIAGRFTFDDGRVTMEDVSFSFKSSPARFARGTVDLRDTGQFELRVEDLELDDFRLDQPLRKLMPPVMAQFARRLDDKTFRFSTDLGIGWSGRPGDPAWCDWADALVVFNGNTIETGLPLERIQGQADHLRGRFDGQKLEVHGRVNLDSVGLLGLQLTRLSTPIDVVENVATLREVRGDLLGGELTGQVMATLDATPRYEAALAVRDAELREYFRKAVPGRQDLRGRINGWVKLEGLGSDLHTLSGRGEAHLGDGKLGEFPPLLRLVKLVPLLRLSPAEKSLFDSADATFQIRDGQTRFDQLKLTGDAFSLQGSGTLSSLGQLDLGLYILAGRDEALHVRYLSAAIREATGQILRLRVHGTPANPKYDPVVLQPATQALRHGLLDRKGRESR